MVWDTAITLPTVTIVICTHNRAGVVARAVHAAIAQARVHDAEVLVVDNASTDDTASIVAALARDHGRILRVVRESIVGLSAARNRALAEARSPIVAFLDDDAVPHPGWLAALIAAYASDEVACVGGPIRLRFTGSPPPWLTSDFHAALTAYDQGPDPRRLHDCPSWEYPYGANVSFRVAAVRRVGGFATRFGHRGRRQLQHEETDLCLRLDRAGADIRYAPDAVVDHWVMADRLTPAFFLARHWQRGQSGAMCELVNRGWRRALHRFRWWDSRFLFVAPYRARDPIDPGRLLAECRRREAVGYLIGLARGVFLVRNPERPSIAPTGTSIGLARP